MCLYVELCESSGAVSRDGGSAGGMGRQFLMLCVAVGARVRVLLAPPRHVLLPGNLVALMCVDKNEMLKYFCENPEYQTRGVPVRRSHSL